MFRLVVFELTPQQQGYETILAHLRFRKKVKEWEMGGRTLTVEKVSSQRQEAYLEFETELELIEFKLRYL